MVQAVDAFFLQSTVRASIKARGQTVMVLFAFEYVILASDVVRYALKYTMSMADMMRPGGWENKVGGCWGGKGGQRCTKETCLSGAWSVSTS